MTHRLHNPGAFRLFPDEPSYRIDYDDLDVVDLVSQIRAKVDRATQNIGTPPRTPRADAEQLWKHLLVPDDHLEELRSLLSAPQDWNVGPEDLVTSRRGVWGDLVRAVRHLARPLLKLVANAELPLYKQHKINLGIAAALQQLLEENARLRAALAADNATSKTRTSSCDGRAN